MTSLQEAVSELAAEQAQLEAVLQSLTPEQWLAPTPAAGWDVRDQVSHLADTNEICVDTITGGARPLNETALSYSSPEEFTEDGCAKGRAMSPAQVLEWFTTSAKANCDALLAKDGKDRIPWGLGMSATMMATARLMETWAHGCDIRAGVDAPFSKTPRLRSIAFLTLRAVPYALMHGKVAMPPGTLRAELTHDGARWSLGPDDADNLITGDAFEFCRLGSKRITRAQATTLRARGALAEAALDNLRAFL